MPPRELSDKEKAAFAANPAFEKAAQRESKQLLKLPNTDELLDLYGQSLASAYLPTLPLFRNHVRASSHSSPTLLYVADHG